MKRTEILETAQRWSDYIYQQEGRLYELENKPNEYYNVFAKFGELEKDIKYLRLHIERLHRFYNRIVELCKIK